MTDPDSTVRVTQTFSVSPEGVFDAWIDPAVIGRWMFGQMPDEEIVRLTVDARVGGSFSFVVRRAGQEIDHVGVYRELNRPARLEFTWGVVGQSVDESVVTVDIRPIDTGCELTLTHDMDPKWAEYRDRTEAGWTKMLGALAALFE